MKAGFDYIGLGVGAFIFNTKGELFMLKRGKKSRNEVGCWDVPGGRVEFGEMMEDAIRREVKEEFGIGIVTVKQLPAIDHMLPAEKQHWVTNCFVSRIKGNEDPKIMEPDKCEAIGWFPVNKLPQPLTVSTKKNIENYKRNY